MQDNFISSPFFYGLALTLIHFIWQGVLVAAVLKLALMLTSHKKSQLRYGYSTLAMLVNLLLPFITFFILYKPDYLSFSGQASLTATIDSVSKTSMIQHNVWYSNIAEYLPYLAMAWLATITLLSSKLLVELYAVNQLPRRNTIPADAKLTARFNALVTQLALTNQPRLVISLKTNVPIAIGWLKPVVLIPVSMLTGLTPNQLDMLILHELAHIRRHDYLVNFIQTLVEILLFFHPAVLWVSNQMRNEREYCSDDIAVKNCGDAIAYAHTLADTASLCNKHRNRSIPSMAMAASGGDLKQRVVRLIDQHHCTNGNDISKWVASLVIILSIALIASKEFVQLPHIDFSSGNISLYLSTNDVVFKDSQNNDPLHNSDKSIAQQLLAGKKDQVKSKVISVVPKPNEKIIVTKVVHVKEPNSDALPLTRKTMTNSNLVNSSPVDSNFVDSNFVDNNVMLSPTKTYSSKQSLENKTTLINVKTTDTASKNSYKIVPSSMADKKSISELSFTRTSAKNQLKNPYASQVASLLDEPSTKSKHSIIEENSIKASPVTRIVESKTIELATKTNNRNAEVITSFEPKYPSMAKRKGIELEVLIDFTIDKNGRVKDIYFKSKSKLGYFRSTIRHAMDKWRFKPAQINGEAAESKMSKIFSFSLLK
jgi:TonB family protein